MWADRSEAGSLPGLYETLVARTHVVLFRGGDVWGVYGGRVDVTGHCVIYSCGV